MLQTILGNAEWLALGLNVFMTAAFTAQRDWSKALYWLGTVFVVLGVISMRWK